jgi:ketosteroid isomerase-like protein
MSQENVEIVRAAIDAWSRGDWDTALKDTAPDFEYDLSRAIGPIRGVYRRDQTEEAWRDFTEGLTFARIEPHELIEAGEHVVVPVDVSRGGSRRHRSAGTHNLALHLARQPGRARVLVPGKGGGPRSRRAVGVGDVG